jgi:hypothetical protein
MRIMFVVSIILLSIISTSLAHDENSSEAQEIIESGISCEQLTENQIETIGDYYMEQLHLGKCMKLWMNA